MSGMDAAASILANLPNTAQTGFYNALGQANQQAATDAMSARYGVRAYNPGLAESIQNQDLAYNADQRAQAQLPFDLAQKQAATANTQAATASTAQRTAAAEGLLPVQQRLAAVNFMQSAVASGGDIGAAFDSTIGKNPQAYGLDPANLAAARQQIVTNPALLDQFKTQLTGVPGMVTYGAGGAAPAGATGAAGVKAQAATQQQTQGQQDVSGTIAAMKDTYAQLDAGGGTMPSGPHTIDQSVASAFANSRIGRLIGMGSGTQNEQLRQQYEGMRQGLMLDIKKAANLGVRMLDTNQDQTRMLSMLGAPGQSKETVNVLLDMIDKRYGAAQAGTPMAPITSADLDAAEAAGKASVAPPPSALAPASQPTAIYPGYVNPNTGARYIGGQWNDPASWQMPGGQ